MNSAVQIIISWSIPGQEGASFKADNGAGVWALRLTQLASAVARMLAEGKRRAASVGQPDSRYSLGQMRGWSTPAEETPAIETRRPVINRRRT